MDRLYKLRFFGYRQLSVIAASAIEKLHFPDVEVDLVECNVNDVRRLVAEGVAEGVEVFIAGSANAAEFQRSESAWLITIESTVRDYLLACKKALALGKMVGIVRYDYAKEIDMDFIRYVLGCDLRLICYEFQENLPAVISESGCDVIVGASYANEIAQNLAIPSVLVYPGEDTIRDSIVRARDLAKKLRMDELSRSIQRALMNSSGLGIIVSDSTDRAIMVNRSAEILSGLPAAQIRGKKLAEVLPQLDPEKLRKSGRTYMDCRKRMNETMVRCIQSTIEVRTGLAGILTTLQIDNLRPRRQKDKEEASSGFSKAYKLENLVSCSAEMKKLVSQIAEYKDSVLPVVIRGETGTGRITIAKCLAHDCLFCHERVEVVNLATIPPGEAQAVLLGNRQQNSILLACQNGTVILENLERASTDVQECLIDILNRGAVLPVGTNDLIRLNLRLITVLSDQESELILPELKAMLQVVEFRVPPLRNRKEDIVPLFQEFMNRDVEQNYQKKMTGRMEAILLNYSWPQNVLELRMVCKRYAYSVNRERRLTNNAKQRALFEAIGEKNLLASLMAIYPALFSEGNHTDGEFRMAVEEIKRLLLYTNQELTQILGISRTTLWRKMSQGK